MSERAVSEYERWKSQVSDPELAAELAGMDATAVEDAFFQDLEFGTGGLRGTLGAGSNRMNVYTVAQATQGLADYLNANFEAPSVAVAHDSRHKGEDFAQVVAEVLAANGVRALLYPRLEPTPALSFATRDQGCAAGINVTASHNPAAYNGYKVYGPDGCQITTEAARAIQEAIARVDAFADVRRMPFAEAQARGLASWLGEDVLDRFVDAVALQNAGVRCGDLKLVYTPLNGTGLECVGRILERVGATDVTVVPEQAAPDGDFPTCPYPNPEIREALERGLALASQTGADLLLATDPDADRVGIAVPHGGDYVLLSGNEVGILLTDWLAGRAADAGEDLTNRVVVSTIVSSAMLDALAAERGFELRRTLTGFKYIGEQIGLLETAGETQRYLFGFEESYGYLAGTHVRDKDAVVASMLICQMAADYKGRGLDLVQAMDALYGRLGYYRNRTVSLSYPGAEGAAQMKAIMAGLRAQAPAEVAGLAVEKVVDYAPGVAMPVRGGADAGSAPQTLPPANVFELQLAGENKLIVRPSGTEPKIKAYVFARGAAPEAADELCDRLEAGARELLRG
jgi:phosphoglucomutase